MGRLHASTARGMGSIYGQGTKTLQPAQYGQKFLKNKMGMVLTSQRYGTGHLAQCLLD